MSLARFIQAHLYREVQILVSDPVHLHKDTIKNRHSTEFTQQSQSCNIKQIFLIGNSYKFGLVLLVEFALAAYIYHSLTLWLSCSPFRAQKLHFNVQSLPL